jgi:hypothetical protein
MNVECRLYKGSISCHSDSTLTTQIIGRGENKLMVFELEDINRIEFRSEYDGVSKPSVLKIDNITMKTTH